MATPHPNQSPAGALLKLEMIRPIESSNLRVDGIVETCINVAEINRAREFYQSVFNFEAMVSDERFCALRAGPDVLLLFTQGGSNDPVVIPEASSLRMRPAAQDTSPLPFPRTRSRLGEPGCVSVESKLNRKFSGSEEVPACISGTRMPTCLSSPLQASGRIIETLEDGRGWIGFQRFLWSQTHREASLGNQFRRTNR